MELNILKKLLLLFISMSLHLSAETLPDELSVMTLNVYGWKTMPQHSDDYAQLIKSNNIDIVGIQEGADDWKLTSKYPTDYSRSIKLNESLGECWQHKFQIFINQCAGVAFIESGRFDLTDGKNATRTGEYAIITKLKDEKANNKYLFVNIHWDHESEETRIANANETASLINSINIIKEYPTILVGDFNSQCNSKAVSMMQLKTKMTLLKHAGIDCIFTKKLEGNANVITASPSDHPSIIATLVPQFPK